MRLDFWCSEIEEALFIDSWYIYVNGGDEFQMTIFDIINSLFKFWLGFESFCFKYVVDTWQIKITVKGCDSWWTYGRGGNTFNMIIFDIINIPIKCWFRFEFFCFKAVVCTKLIKKIVKGCSYFSNEELLWKIDWYLIDNLISFREACFFSWE